MLLEIIAAYVSTLIHRVFLIWLFLLLTFIHLLPVLLLKMKQIVHSQN